MAMTEGSINNTTNVNANTYISITTDNNTSTDTNISRILQPHPNDPRIKNRNYVGLNKDSYDTSSPQRSTNNVSTRPMESQDESLSKMLKEPKPQPKRKMTKKKVNFIDEPKKSKLDKNTVKHSGFVGSPMQDYFVSIIPGIGNDPNDPRIKIANSVGLNKDSYDTSSSQRLTNNVSARSMESQDEPLSNRVKEPKPPPKQKMTKKNAKFVNEPMKRKMGKDTVKYSSFVGSPMQDDLNSVITGIGNDPNDTRIKILNNVGLNKDSYDTSSSQRLTNNVSARPMESQDEPLSNRVKEPKPPPKQKMTKKNAKFVNEPMKRKMGKDTVKYSSFVGSPMQDKLISEIPGIGKASIKKLNDKGFRYAYQLLGQYLVLEKCEKKFIMWMKGECKINREKNSSDCCRALKEWTSNFM